uniref:ORF295 protein n=1 Tax=Mankyua chejuensis TaxID=996148 RepID=H8Y613_9MONI|nr:hypothetical protein MACHC_p030 [Mankyua chejuensis]ADZ47981.1 hypothetical protein [Mankyua chejuensis]AJJ48611.1 ORF295 [Mankyua chejuensis]
MLFHLFHRRDSSYYLNKFPIKQLFATSCETSEGYPRVKPKVDNSLGTISNIKRECKRVIKETYQRVVLPRDLCIEEIDMVACYTGIFAGLMGEKRVPNTWQAYHSGSFWDFIMEKRGREIPKAVLKTLLYSGLNGASLKGQGAIRTRLMEERKDLSGDDLDEYIRKAVQHPIVVELAKFKEDIGKREKIYWPTRARPYYGKLEEEAIKKRDRSRYHEGLMTSRVFASHELVLTMLLTESLMKEKLGLPICLENDGLLLLTHHRPEDPEMSTLSHILSQASQDFLNVNLLLEYKK